MKTSALLAVAIAMVVHGTAFAVPPAELDYQGKVLVNDLPFSGSGYFKFALANAGGTTNFWSNDGTTAGEPAGFLTNDVANGVFSVVLGAAPMTALNPVIFALNTNLHLRVWFGDTASSFLEMLPAQRVVSVGYALNSDLLDGFHATGIVAAATNGVTLSGDVSGPVGNVQLGVGVVGTPELANNAVTSSRIVDGAIVGADIADGTVAGIDIADNSVQSVDIFDGTITSNDVATDSLIAANLAPDSVGSSEIAAGAVASSELLDGSIVDLDVSGAANISGTKIVQGSTLARGTLQLAAGSTGTLALAAGHPFLNAYGVVNTLTAAAPNSVLTVAGVGGIYVSNVAPATLRIGSLPMLDLDAVIWVATNGTAVGPGTIAQPYDTPQNGYNAAAARYPSQPAAVVIAAGTYTGVLAMSAGNIHVMGLERAEIGGLTIALTQSPFMASKVRIQNLTVLGFAWCPLTTVSGVKFYNVKMLGGLWLNGSALEVQNCFITQGVGAQFGALRIGDGGSLVNTVSLHHCSIKIANAGIPALKVEANVQNFELLWSEVVNTGGGPAITDADPGPISPVHLYAHNWIKAPVSAGAITALNDWAVQQGPTIGFFNNTVLGNVGFANGGTPHAQFFGNNMVMGRINHPGPGNVFGWLQAGAGAGADAANNTEHQMEYPALPDAYND